MKIGIEVYNGKSEMENPYPYRVLLTKIKMFKNLNIFNKFYSDAFKYHKF